MKLIKFGSPKLDTPSLRYEFLKHAFKSVKTNKKSITTQTDRWGPLVSRTHASAIKRTGGAPANVISLVVR